MHADALAVLSEDPVMARLIRTHEPYVEPDWEAYERLCIAIVNQQLSTASATAIRKRVFELFDGTLTPEAMLAVEDDALRNAGVSRQKIEYLRNAARAFQEHDLTPQGLVDCSNEQVLDRLTEITGVGEWTAQMYLLFVLGRPDILPLGDLAVRRGIQQLYGDGEELTRAEMRAVAEQWRPYRSVATRYIWADYEADT